MRTFQYESRLQAADIEIQIVPLFPDSYVAGLQQGRRPKVAVLRGYAKRLKTLLCAGSYDLLWIEKESLPWMPASLEKACLLSRIPYVLDYDDAVFHSYDQHRWPIMRWLLGGKHPAIIRDAAMVVAGNEYLADFARKAGATRVEVLPTVIDLERYHVSDVGSSGDALSLPCVGWIGQRATAEFLRPLAPLFQQLAADRKCRFTAIGIDTRELGLPMAAIRWSEQTEVDSIRSFDVGIMPLDDAPFQRGKCGYKLIQYMACGLPVVASPIGVNLQIVEDGVNGFLADTPAEWKKALGALLADADLRQRMGQAGRRAVEQKYCIQVTGPRLVELLAGLATVEAA